MWRAVLWLFLTPGQLLWPFALGDAADLLYHSEDADVDFDDFDNTEDNSTVVVSTMTADDGFLTRVRRFEDQALTPGSYDVQEVKAIRITKYFTINSDNDAVTISTNRALKKILEYPMIEALTTNEIVKPKNFFGKLATNLDREQFQNILENLVDKRAVSDNFNDKAAIDNEVFNQTDSDSNEEADDINTSGLTDNKKGTQHYIPARTHPVMHTFETSKDNTLDISELKDIINTEYLNISKLNDILNREHTEFTSTSHNYEHFKPITINQGMNSQEEFDPKTAKSTNDYATTSINGNTINIHYTRRKSKFWVAYDSDYNTLNAIRPLTTTVRDKPHRTLSNPARRQKDKPNQQSETLKDDANATAPAFDIPALLDIIANLTLDYGTNLTMRFNETFQKFQIPTCQTLTTMEPTTTQNDVEKAEVVAKCFVCGLTTPGIPRDAYCADAFAGDFLPLVPVDPKARGQIARYRKYCQFLDVSGVQEYPEKPRSLFGRFTGGCSVRWIDLSGVYTQRTCRNRRRAHTGKHFLSKRMAKLEMALGHLDNGCIVSPMATLVPLSRGISLYARFHACVCTGSWCNGSKSNQTWIVYLMLLAIWTLKPIAT